MKSLGERMKEYESVSRNFLMRKNPVILRLDGKAFHTFTKGMKRPFDDILMETMQETAKQLCEEIQCCKLAYTQSDEISLLLIDYETPETETWFNNNVQKMTSLSASMATLYFNTIFQEKVNEKINSTSPYYTLGIEDLKNRYAKKFNKALFDSRAISVPKEDVINYFIWRQEDATRNSIQMVGQANFSQDMLHKKNCNMIQEMLFSEKNINWNDIEIPKKRGTCVIKVPKIINEEGLERLKWTIDKEIPIFKKDREYIDKIVYLR